MRQNNRIMLYAGTRMATNKAIFLSNSFILHPDLPEKVIEPFYFNDGVSLSLLCSTDGIKPERTVRKEKFIESKPRHELFVDSYLRSINDPNPGRCVKEYASKPLETLSKDGELLKKMRAWSMYCNDNNKQPFILAIPLSNKMSDFVKELVKLSEIISVPLPSLLVLYKKRREHMISEAVEQYRVKIYEDFNDLSKKNQ